MSVWPKQIKEAVEKERPEEREQSINLGEEEFREVFFFNRTEPGYHTPFIHHSFWIFQENQTWILNWILLSSQNNSVHQSTHSRGLLNLYAVISLVKGSHFPTYSFPTPQYEIISHTSWCTNLALHNQALCMMFEYLRLPLTLKFKLN